jgi:hypothetical protein
LISGAASNTWQEMPRRRSRRERQPADAAADNRISFTRLAEQ